MKGVGRVLLVGAGPGDPGLITVKGAAALRSADVVVYDALAAPELLDLTPPQAERINVGKRGHEDPTRPQGETTHLLLELAREGKTVVRLKGGDPFVFGRGGEEASACVAAGIPFEVIPGVSSVVGALAYAGIPVTDRRHSASFAVVTGHKDPTQVSRETRWSELAHAADTLVILMGMRNLEALLAGVIEGGRSPDTPAAAIANGTLPVQQVVEAPLGELAQRVAEAGLGAPAVVVIGEVVRLRQELAWFETRSLFGARVLVTRPAHQSGELVAALRECGAIPVVVPMIRLAPARDLRPIDEALGRLADYDAILFTSVNAIHFLESRARELDVPLRDVAPPVGCVGPTTAERARRAGLEVAVVPETRFDAQGLLDAALARWPAPGPRLFLAQAEHPRPVLADGLRAAGVRVDAAVMYRTVPADVDGAALCRQLVGGGLDVLTFTSPSTAQRFADLLDAEALEAAQRCVVAAIGSVTADALRRLGLPAQVVPEQAGVEALVEALASHFAGALAGAQHQGESP